MKILMIFVDMLRPNRFGAYNKGIQPNQIDDLIYDLGGTLYTNCFSPGPDTPRSMACFYSGLSPMENGCDTRVKWPSKFLHKNTPSIFDHFVKNNYKMNFFSNPNERKGGLFPPSISDIGNHNKDYDLEKYLSDVILADNHLLFLSIPDYHWALQDWGYTRKGEKVAIAETRRSLDIIFDRFNADEFDHIFLFSDHGFKFNAQLKVENWYEFVNRDRSNIFMFSRKKGDHEISYEDKLCSIQDVTHAVDEIFGYKSDFSLLGHNSKRDYVVIEDHYSISPPKVNQDVDIWAVITKDVMYIRTLENAVLVKNDEIIDNEVKPKYDEILKRESQFGRYYDEYEKVFTYHKLILAQTSYMNGNSRPSNSRQQQLLRWIQAVKDKLRLACKKRL